MSSRLLAVLLLVVPLCFAHDVPNPELQKLYKERNWFRLRDALKSGQGPAFYQGVVACAFNNTRVAERDFRSVIRANPNSDQAYESHNLLAYAYLLEGRYKEAQEHLEQMRMIKPDNASDRAAMSMLKAINQHTPATKVTRHHTMLRSRVKGKVPVTVNGKPADYAFDSNATISIMSESEANRLGMTIYEGGSLGVVAARGDEARFRIGVADKVVVGKTVLRHLLFLVFRDDQPPFNELKQSERGFVGLQVMRALQSIRWTTDGTIEVAFDPVKDEGSLPNLLFDGSDLIAQVTIQNQRLSGVLDTGSEETNLWPAFAKRFPEMIEASGKKSAKLITGLSGAEEIESLILPELALELGKSTVVLRSVHVLLKETHGQWYAARLGIDLFDQASAVTFNFKAMTLTLAK